MPASQNYYEFKDFRLDPVERLLFRDGELVPLAPKALDTLLALVERRNHIVEKDELMNLVWPGTFVEEGSLSQNVHILRKLLGDSGNGNACIETIPKRGYRFVAPVRTVFVSASPRFAPDGTPEALPPPVVEHPSEPAARVFSKRPSLLRVAAMAATVLLLCAGAFAFWITRSWPVLSFAPRDWILVTDFANRTGDPRFDKGLLTALTVDLEQSHYANVFPRSRIATALQRMGKAAQSGQGAVIDEAVGREICVRENIRGLVTTSIARVGERYVLDASLVNPVTGEVVKSHSVRAGSENEILDALDSIASSLRRDLGETLYSIRRNDKPLPLVTTASLEALQHYAEARALWSGAKYQDAQTELSLALRADPDFAMAHAFLGGNYYSHIFSNPVKGKEHFERALALSGRVTDRERMFIEAGYAGAQGHWDEAMRLQEAYLRVYPDDLNMQLNLANAFLAARRLEEAIGRFQEMLRIDPNNTKALINIATCYNMMGKYKEALTFYSRAFRIEPDRVTSENVNHEYGYALIGAGQLEKAADVFNLMLGKPNGRFRGLRSLALLNLYEGKYAAAAPLLAEAIRINEAASDRLAAARSQFFLSQLLEGQGDAAGQQRALDSVIRGLRELPGNSWLVSYVGVSYARMRRVEEAARVLEDVRKATDRKSPRQAADLDRLEAEVELARGNTDHALQLLDQAAAEISGPLVLESRGYAFSRAGKTDQAIGEYESLRQKFGQSIGWEAQQPWLVSHVALAQAYAARGDAEAAGNVLKELLSLWKDGDAGLPLRREAYQLLLRLHR